MVVQQTTVFLHAIGAITVADGKWKWKAPYAGEVIAVGGYIKTLGTGGGTGTDIQLRNETPAPDVDILSTVGRFDVTAATNLLQNQVVNVNNASFAAADIIGLDVDAISTGPADAVVWMVVNLFMDDV